MPTQVPLEPRSLTTRATLAKRRARRRADSAGAVIFIVAMTLVVLASLGAFALRAASTETRTAGYARASTQTRYLTEYGALGVAHELQGPRAQLILDLMTNPATRDGGVGRPVCASLSSLPATFTSPAARACRQILANEASLGWTQLATDTRRLALDNYTSPSSPGSFGTRIRGNFVVEVTEPMQGTAPAGYDQTLGFCFANFTVTSTAVTFPDLPATSENALGILAGQNMITGRARVIGGPIRCPR